MKITHEPTERIELVCMLYEVPDEWYIRYKGWHTEYWQRRGQQLWYGKENRIYSSDYFNRHKDTKIIVECYKYRPNIKGEF